MFPYECFSNIQYFLDNKTLYKCLFVNRYWCRLSVTILWREPFNLYDYHYLSIKSSTVINTLLSCLDENEISSLIPCRLNFNNQTPLFEYGKFIRNIDHNKYVCNIMTWFEYPPNTVVSAVVYQDCRIQKLANAMYHMIMRQGSNLQELNLSPYNDGFIDTPRFSTLITYNPGITNLKSLSIELGRIKNSENKHQNVIEFISKVSKCCNGIINCEISSLDVLSNISNMHLSSISLVADSLADIVKSQPLERIVLDGYGMDENVKKIVYALEFRTKTLKDLIFNGIKFKDVSLSFMSKLERLERLEFVE